MDEINWIWVFWAVVYMLFGLILLGLERRWGFPLAFLAALIKTLRGSRAARTFKQRWVNYKLKDEESSSFYKDVSYSIFLWPLSIFFSCIFLLVFLAQQLWYLVLFLIKNIISTLHFFHNGFRWEKPEEKDKVDDETMVE